MQEIIERFSEIISSYCILQDEAVEGGHKFKVIIRFIESSRLEGRDFTFPKKRYYSFHWMKEDNSLIIRWDNTEHHPTIKTFPFHIHIGKKSICFNFIIHPKFLFCICCKGNNGLKWKVTNSKLSIYLFTK